MQQVDRQIDLSGDCLECLGAQCLARDPKKPRYKPNDEDGLPYRRTIGRATVSITKPIDSSTERKRETARTSIGARIGALSIIVKSRGGFTRDAVEHISRTDKGTVFDSQGHTVATVQYPFEHAQAYLLRVTAPTIARS